MPPTSVGAFTNVVGCALTEADFREMVEGYFAEHGGTIRAFECDLWKGENPDVDKLLLDVIPTLELQQVGIGVVYSYQSNDDSIAGTRRFRSQTGEKKQRKKNTTQ